MIHHDLSHWPLIISVSSGLASLDDMRAFTDAWNGWLARGERFAFQALPDALRWLGETVHAPQGLPFDAARIAQAVADARARAA